MRAFFVLLLCAMSSCNDNWVWKPDYYGSMNWYDEKHTHVIISLVVDIIKDTDERIRSIETLRLDNFRTASFEIGFLNYVIMEEYRKMLECYNTSVIMDWELYGFETMMYMVEVEAHYWQIDHLQSMQHEIERKYNIHSKIEEAPGEAEIRPTTIDPNFKTKKTKRTRDRLGEQIAVFVDKMHTTKKRSTRWWWPIEYGWEVEYYW
ncbi:uncharacterized protein LOC135085392 [Ostrinia nubilalis]|uniref:uncharacterized protein LOC135085392 n=1 Tax=Ostrinia nubilalis TaxID=29057 RepID=UPI0030825E4E